MDKTPSGGVDRNLVFLLTFFVYSNIGVGSDSCVYCWDLQMTVIYFITHVIIDRNFNIKFTEGFLVTGFYFI